MATLNELYLSIFVLFSQLSAWEGRLKASTASMCLSVVVGILAVALLACVQTATHHYLAVSRWIIGGTFAVIFVVNDYFLVVRGRGIAFEKRFRSFSKRKRTLLYLAVSVVLLVTCIALYISATSYHEIFHLPKK